MANRSKRVGTAWESGIVTHLNESGYPNVERRALAGALDKGDIAGMPFVIEAKAHRTPAFPAWVREADAEALNAGAPFGVVWAKVVGKAHPRDGVIAMSPAGLLVVAGIIRERDILASVVESLQARA
jgi:hypothetical protein